MNGPTKTYSSIDEAGKAIKLAHEQCTDLNPDGSLKGSGTIPAPKHEITHLMATDEETKLVYALFADIQKDLEQLRSKLTTIGAPRSAECLKNAIQYHEGIKAILEEELAGPR